MMTSLIPGMISARKGLAAAVAVLASVLVQGCSSQVPERVRKAPADAPELQVVRSDVQAYLGRSVRWGGKIAEVENLEAGTEIAVVSLPLQRKGRPVTSSESGGRFLARVSGFVDPEIYKEGRLLTVFGTVSGDTERKIGEYQYRYPVVSVQAYYLWPVEIYSPYYYDPVLRDPFFYYGPYYYGPYTHF